MTFSTKCIIFLQDGGRPGRYTLLLEVLFWAEYCTQETQLGQGTAQEVYGRPQTALSQNSLSSHVIELSFGIFTIEHFFLVSGSLCNIHLKCLSNTKS